MKKLLSFILLSVLCGLSAGAADKDSTVYYTIPDSIKAVSFLAEISVQAVNTKKEIFAGIRTDVVKLSLESDKKKAVVFEFPTSAKQMAKGLDVIDDEKGELEWNYDWSIKEAYKLLLAVATDSAGNFSLYSGYIWLPKENKWKLIGTCKIEGQWNTIRNPSVFFTNENKKQQNITIQTGQVWLQRNNGTWKKLQGDQPAITINLFSHVDSARQNEIEKQLILQAIAAGKTDVKDNMEGVYYKIMKEGNGIQVSINDTVTVNYKLNIFNDGSLVEETKDKPATFPLNRLIKGWQVGVPLCKVGGKIKLLIPSAMAYSIRNRAAKIPPNSILVFEIEVIDAKPRL